MQAFTGSIVEHSHGMPSKPTSESSDLPQVFCYVKVFAYCAFVHLVCVWYSAKLNSLTL